MTRRPLGSILGQFREISGEISVGSLVVEW